MEKNLQNIYPTYYNLLMVQDFWQANIIEGIRKIKCKYGHDDKKCETCGITSKDCNCYLEHTNFKDNLIE